jgi:predicted cupin superfamily sugar epimerase
MISADEWIRKLSLSAHPEGGYFKEVYRSNEFVKKEHLPPRFTGNRCFATSIYFLLKSGEFSAFHRIRQDEIWHFYDGCPLTIHMISENGVYSSAALGNKAKKGMHLQFCVPAGCYFGALPDEEYSYSLTGCTVAPGFEYDDFEMPERNTLISLFPQHTAIIEKLTRV